MVSALTALAVVTGRWGEALQTSIGLLALFARAAGWWFRSFTLDEYELILDEGILQRRQRVVPYSRIQQVEVRQKLLHRVFGVAVIDVETAAEGGATAIRLRLLDEGLARRLRAFLLASQQRVRGDRLETDGTAAAAAPAGPATSLLRLGPGVLALAGATGPAAVGFVVAALTPSMWLAAFLTAGADQSAAVGAAAAGGLVLLVVAAAAAGGVVAQVARDYGYELSVLGDDVHLRHGLFELREHTLPRRRVQQIRLLDNPVRRALGMVTVVLHSAASPGGSEGASNMIAVPLVPLDEVDGLLAALMGEDGWAAPVLVPRPPAAHRRAIMRRAVLLAVAVTVPVVAWWPAGIVALILVTAAWPWGNAAHRLAGYQFAGPVVGLASGVVLHRMDLVPRRRIQSGRTRSSYLQRRADLASVFLDVAGTQRRGPLRLSPGLHDLAVDVAEARARALPSRQP